MARISHSCVGKQSGKGLREYGSKAMAEKGADHAYYEYGTDLEPYKCRYCECWHLSPRNRQTPNVYCAFCNKNLYGSKEDAERRSEITCEEFDVQLDIYKCPLNDGWHLTKRYSRPK